MKKLFILFATAVMLFAGGCRKYDDTPLKNRVGSLENRVAALEELCKQMNTNISSLQTLVTALQNNDYVTGVTPVTKNGETIGYTIVFSKSAPITIYHGENGRDGINGTDGEVGRTPVIGIRQDTDGIYYWTLDGSWLLDSNSNKIKAEGKDGANGENGKDGADGKDGQNGADGKDGEPGAPGADGKDGVNGADGKDGEDGKDGITPQLKIEGGCWFVSTDNGATWTNLGKATGENGVDGTNGVDGKDGIDGDSFFKSVDTSDSEYVVFTLADGTEIKLPTWYAFEQLKTLCNQMNTNINALQSIVEALQDNDYVKRVTPVMQDGKEIGYTITFSKSNPITIYHGQDGKDGANGKDGHTPVIGIRQDAAGVYYWTLDGEWLLDDSGNKIKAEGKDGENGKDGADGQNGTDGKDGVVGKDGENGKDGQNGADGITPQLKIENGYWYVSTDKGATWTNLGRATGENGKDGKDGVDGKDGASGDSMFRSVEQDEDNVYFTLADGGEIVLPKRVRLSVAFTGASSLTFYADESKSVDYVIAGGNENNVVKVEMLNNDNAYALYASSRSASEGTITITAKEPTVNRVIVTVSDGRHTVMSAIDVSMKKKLNRAIEVKTPGTLSELLEDYDMSAIENISVFGALGAEDYEVLNSLPNLKDLVMSCFDADVIPDGFMSNNNTICYVRLYTASLGENTFCNCSNLGAVELIGCTLSSTSFCNCNNLGTVNLSGRCTLSSTSFCNCQNLSAIYMQGPVNFGYSSFDGSPVQVIRIQNINDWIASSEYSYNLIGVGLDVDIEHEDGSVTEEALTTLDISASWGYIQPSTFEDCRSLSEVYLSGFDIGNNAFAGCRNLGLVSLSCVSRIESGAFQNSGIYTLSLSGEDMTIDDYAFYNCPRILGIECYFVRPPQLGENAFDDSVFESCELWVPSGCREAYASAEGWSRFVNIKELSF